MKARVFLMDTRFVADAIGSDIVTHIFAYNGSQYIDYESQSLHSLVIIQDARSKSIDVPLTLTFSRWYISKMYLCLCEPLGVSGSCRTRIRG